MPSTYTTNNGIELIGTGEQTGTWGDTTNTNFELIDVALDGQATITLASAGTSGSPNTLPITDGVASNGRNRALIFTDGGDLGATAYVQLTPDDAEKIIFVRNSLSGSRNLILFQGTYNAANDFVLAAGKDAIVKFDGAGTGAVASALLEDLALDAVTVTTGNITTVNATTVDSTNLEVTNLKAKDGTSAGSIANSTGVVTLASSVLTTTDINGGTIDGATIGGSSAAAGTFTTLTATGNVTLGNAATDTVTVTADVASDLIPSADGMYDLGASGSEWQDLYIDGTANIDSLVADTADINGGTIDGATIGGSTAAAGSFTTLSASGSLSANSFTVGQANAADVPMAVYSTDANCIISLNDDSTTSTSHVGVQAVGDNLALRAGSAQRVYVASDGDVGIGTTNPLAQLHSFNTGSPYAAMMESNQTSSSVVFASSGSSNKYHQGINTGDGTDMRIFAGNTTRMTVTSAGNVGIGTTSPSSPLDISGSGDIRAEIESTNLGDVSLDLLRTGANSYRLVNDAGVFRIQHGATPAGVDTNDRFTILNTGNVGINTTSPTAALDVSGSIRLENNPATVTIQDTGGTAGFQAITLANDNDSFNIQTRDDSGNFIATDYTLARDVNGATYHQWNIQGSAAARLNSSGLGIGMTNPTVKLVVYDDSTTTSTSFRATNASYAGAVNATQTVRTANTAFSFYTATSDISGSPDTEFRLRGDGNAFADGTWTGGGADYAEYFEWVDGNPDGEDRVGISVVLDGTKIRAAVDGEEPIGVISGNPSVVGDGDIDRWKQKYLRDDFGRYIWEDYDVLTWTEGDKDVSYNADSVPDDVVAPDDAQTVVQQRRKLNPAFDPDIEYISRENRPEWDTVGLMGKLRIRKGQPTGSRWIKMRDVSATVEEWLVR